MKPKTPKGKTLHPIFAAFHRAAEKYQLQPTARLLILFLIAHADEEGYYRGTFREMAHGICGSEGFVADVFRALAKAGLAKRVNTRLFRLMF